MATGAGPRDTLRIRVLGDSAAGGAFVVSVRCPEPRLLHFWCAKPAFRDGQVEQAEVSVVATATTTPPPTEMDFLLRVEHRAPGVPDGHYWAPFVLALCLDALQFRFRLPPGADGGVHDIVRSRGELLLLR